MLHSKHLCSTIPLKWYNNVMIMIISDTLRAGKDNANGELDYKARPVWSIRLVTMGASDATAVQLQVGGDGVVGPHEVVHVPATLGLHQVVVPLSIERCLPVV